MLKCRCPAGDYLAKFKTCSTASWLLNCVQVPGDTRIYSAVFGYFHGWSREEVFSD